MRVRTADNLLIRQGPVSETYYKPDGSICSRNSFTNEWVNGTFSVMHDAGSAKTDEIRTRSLAHQRSTIQSYVSRIAYPFYSSACPPEGVATFEIAGCIGPGYYIRENPWMLDDSEINLCIREAFNYFKSGCAPKETLLANFAWELPDVRNLWPTFKTFLKTFKKNGLKKLTPVQDARRTVKTFSGTYLAYQFGVAPLIGDLIKVYERLTSLDDHITWLRKNSGQIVKVEYRASLSQMTWVGPLPSRPAAPPSGGGLWRKIASKRAGFKAWASITYDVSALTDLQLKTRTLMRSFGLNNPAAIVWEAVPYSFVVDWITNVGKLIDLLEVPIVLPTVFHDCGRGVFTESVIEDYYTTGGISALLRTTKTRGYGREPGLPINISSLSLDTPTAKQLVLGLALIGQKF